MNPETAAVREHYDRLTSLYHLLWGEHIHHGYWDGEAATSPHEAQERLVERLADFAEIPRGARVLDIGCGLGGSARWLARHRDCSVLGVTISPVQAQSSTGLTRKAELSERVKFAVQDANILDVPSGSFDAVWVVECSEHLADKASFLAACAKVLKPGGRLALCAWLRGEDTRADELRNALVTEVCAGMLCPDLGTVTEYGDWMRLGGFEDVRIRDVTSHVAATWDRCAEIVQRFEVKTLLKAADARTRAFVAAFPAMQRAYAGGAMRYGMLTARSAPHE